MVGHQGWRIGVGEVSIPGKGHRMSEGMEVGWGRAPSGERVRNVAKKRCVVMQCT